MNENTGEYVPPFRFEFEQLHRLYNHRLEELYGGPIEYRMIPVQKDLTAKELNRAILISGKERPSRDVEAVCFTDHDDTIEPYTRRKTDYIQSLISVESVEQPEQVGKILEILNKAARARPITGVGPERYSPLLEMVADTVLLEKLKQHHLDKISPLLVEPSEKNARQFINDEIIPLFSGKVDTFVEDGKQYFREAKHQALAVKWDEKPLLVSEEVWSRYVTYMTKPTIPETEIAGLNLDPKIFWVVSTFGEVGFQTEKVINALQLIKVKTGRVPDEILLFTRGRKEPIVSAIIENLSPEIPFYALDDSLGQLEKYATNPKIIPLRAIRMGSKRANGLTPGNIRTINMEQGDLNHQLLAIISKDKPA